MTLPTTIISRPHIDIAHQRVHEGNHFFVHRIFRDVNIANPKLFLIDPPSQAIIPSDTIELHLIFEIESTNIGYTLEFFEDCTITDSGTALTIINNNRRSSTSSLTGVHENPIISTEGTKLFEQITGTATSGGVAGEFERNDEEIILRPGSHYLIRITPLADGLIGNAEFNWYDNRPSSPVPIPGSS